MYDRIVKSSTRELVLSLVIPYHGLHVAIIFIDPGPFIGVDLKMNYTPRAIITDFT